jgi:putative endonuclease
MSDIRKSIGADGEEKAAAYLQEKGYKIISRNVTSRVGEIDIVAEKDRKVIFCEVRTKISDKHGRPSDSLTSFKKQHFGQAIRWYLMKHNLRQYKLSADFISVILHRDRSVKEIVHYENVMQPRGMY